MNPTLTSIFDGSSLRANVKPNVYMKQLTRLYHEAITARKNWILRVVVVSPLSPYMANVEKRH